jgi:hypothetical protein
MADLRTVPPAASGREGPIQSSRPVTRLVADRQVTRRVVGVRGGKTSPRLGATCSDALGRKEITLVIVIHMQYGLRAQQLHHERIEHALGPRPEPYGPIARPSTQRSFAPWSRIAHLVRLPALLIPRVASRRA